MNITTLAIREGLFDELRRVSAAYLIVDRWRTTEGVGSVRIRFRTNHPTTVAATVFGTMGPDQPRLTDPQYDIGLGSIRVIPATSHDFRFDELHQNSGMWFRFVVTWGTVAQTHWVHAATRLRTVELDVDVHIDQDSDVMSSGDIELGIGLYRAGDAVLLERRERGRADLDDGADVGFGKFELYAPEDTVEVYAAADDDDFVMTPWAMMKGIDFHGAFIYDRLTEDQPYGPDEQLTHDFNDVRATMQFSSELGATPALFQFSSEPGALAFTVQLDTVCTVVPGPRAPLLQLAPVGPNAVTLDIFGSAAAGPGGQSFATPDGERSFSLAEGRILFGAPDATDANRLAVASPEVASLHLVADRPGIAAVVAGPDGALSWGLAGHAEPPIFDWAPLDGISGQAPRLVMSATGIFVFALDAAGTPQVARISLDGVQVSVLAEGTVAVAIDAVSVDTDGNTAAVLRTDDGHLLTRPGTHPARLPDAPGARIAGIAQTPDGPVALALTEDDEVLASRGRSWDSAGPVADVIGPMLAM